MGSVRVDWYGHRVKEAVARATPERLRRCALLVERDAKESMRRGGGRKGTPSPPGTPPHVQSNALRSGIASAPEDANAYVVGPTERYGQVHEYGGRLHPQRPFMRPALQRMQDQFPREFEGLI